MNNTKELKAEIAAVATIESMATIYQGIASLRMNQVKDTVAKTKKFIDGVAEIYHHARAAYLANLQRSAPKTKAAALSAIRRNGKIAHVLLSANEHLYGSLILDCYNEFIDDTLKAGLRADLIIVGRFGRDLVESAKLPHKIFYFDLDDDKPALDQSKKIIQLLTQYERVVLHYGRTQTALTQVPDRIEISAGLQQSKGQVKDYLFEPSPEAIMSFFETEMIAAVFNQKVFEHQLSRFAARMVAMDQASQNAQALNENQTKALNRVKLAISNSKQLSTFAGRTLWEVKE